MSTRRVPLLITEEAVGLLYSTYSELGMPSAHRSFGRSRVWGSFGPHDADSMRAQATYLRLISIVEAYIDSVGSMLFGAAATGQAPLLRTLIAEAESQSSTSWSNRKRAFKDYHGISLAACTAWLNVEAETWVRNAIAHGLGRLTPRQRTIETRRRIASVGVAVIDERLEIDLDAVSRCLNDCVRFVRSVDSHVQNAKANTI